MTIEATEQQAFFTLNGNSDGGVLQMFARPGSLRRQEQPVAKSYWLAVACAEHVRRGRREGFMQVNHGKLAPLKRVKPGDGIVYYSPSVRMGEKDGFQSFTAIGYVRNGEPYRGEMGAYQAYRRDVDWLDAPEQSIRPLLDWLDFTQNKNWGYSLRTGLVRFGESDFEFLQEIMMSELAEVKARRAHA